MNMVKKCLKSWIFWLLMSIIIFVLFDLSERYILGVFLILSNIICLTYFSQKNGIKKLLTITICSFSAYLFCYVGYNEMLLDNAIIEYISSLLLVFLFIPAWTLTLLKLVWRDKADNTSKDENKKPVKNTRKKINKK